MRTGESEEGGFMGCVGVWVWGCGGVPCAALPAQPRSSPQDAGLRVALSHLADPGQEEAPRGE